MKLVTWTWTNRVQTVCNCPLDLSVANWIGPRPVNHNETCPLRPSNQEDRG